MILSSLQALTAVQWFSFVYLIAPVMLNLFIPNFTSLTYLLNPLRVLAFYLFLPTMQGFFLTLAIARTFDLSWGNRAGIGAEQEDLKKESQTLMLIQWVCNLVLLVFFFSFANTDWIFWAQLALVVFLLLPMSLLTLGSVIQELGFFWSFLGVALGTCVVLGDHGYLGKEVDSFLSDIPIVRAGWFQATIVILLLIVLKTFFTHCLRFLCHCGTRSRFDKFQERKMSRTHTLTGPVDGVREAPPTVSLARLLGRSSTRSKGMTPKQAEDGEPAAASRPAEPAAASRPAVTARAATLPALA